MTSLSLSSKVSRSSDIPELKLGFSGSFIFTVDGENPKGNKEIWESREMPGVVFMKSAPGIARSSFLSFDDANAGTGERALNGSSCTPKEMGT